MRAAFSFASLVAGASLTNCGGAKDHMSGVTMSISPDPPVKNKPITITLNGNLDEDLEAFGVDLDLKLEILDLFKPTVNKKLALTMDPPIAKGPVNLVVGPFTLPDDLPGGLDAAGQIHLTNAKNEPVACMNLAVNLPVFMEEEEEVPKIGDFPGNCGTASDHLKNLTASKSGQVTTLTGTLDEAVTKLTAVVALKIHEFFSIHVNLNVPVSFAPGFKQGPLKITAGPASSEEEGTEEGLLGVTVGGNIKLNDANSQEIACFTITPKASVKEILV